jgi:hypothetical protein
MECLPLFRFSGVPSSARSVAGGIYPAVLLARPQEMRRQRRSRRNACPREPTHLGLEPVSADFQTSLCSRAGIPPGKGSARPETGAEFLAALSGLRRQSRGKSKTISTAPGNRSCARLRGGLWRTQTACQARSSIEPGSLRIAFLFLFSLWDARIDLRAASPRIRGPCSRPPVWQPSWQGEVHLRPRSRR